MNTKAEKEMFKKRKLVYKKLDKLGAYCAKLGLVIVIDTDTNKLNFVAPNGMGFDVSYPAVSLGESEKVYVERKEK